MGPSAGIGTQAGRLHVDLREMKPDGWQARKRLLDHHAGVKWEPCAEVTLGAISELSIAGSEVARASRPWVFEWHGLLPRQARDPEPFDKLRASRLSRRLAEWAAHD